jgi:hypothetical protein
MIARFHLAGDSKPEVQPKVGLIGGFFFGSLR